MAPGTPAEHHTHWSDLFVIAAGMVAIVTSINLGTTWLTAAGLVLAVTGFAALRGFRWAPISYFLLGLALMFGFSATINSHPFSSKSAAGLSGSLLCILLSLAQVRRRNRMRPPREQPVVSLVLLQRVPRFLDDRLLAAIASSAWNVEFSTSAESNDSHVVVGESPTLIVRTSTESYLVHFAHRRFWDDPEIVAVQLNDVRAQRVLHEHQSWLSVQLMGNANAATRDNAFRRIGRLLAELAGPETLAIVRPDTGAFHVWDDSVAEMLKSESPLECFSVPNAAPVVPVSPDDPIMAAAVAEARRRWPEFVSTFSGRHPEQHFSVKAPVTRDGQTEHIWIDVTSLTTQYVRGKLGNDPVDLNGLKLGDPISVPISSVEDWLYVLTDTPVGGFTIPAVTSAPWRTHQT